MQDLGTLGTGSTYATGVNSSGQVVGYSIDSSGNYQGFLYSGGTMQNLGSGRANGISDYGQIAFTTINANGTASAYEISGVSRYNLGTLGGTWTDAQVMNPNGLIAGSSLLAGNTARMAFMFTMPGQSLQNLSLNLGVYGYVAGISRSGNLAGCTSANGPQQAFVTGAFGEDPLDIDPNGSESVAYGINQKGQAVGFKLFGDAAHAFIWQGGLMTDLNTLLTPASSGWVLTSATDIDDAGQIIGYGTNPSGQTDAFLLTPTTVPEPTTLALLPIAAAALILRRKQNC
jgi:probable HAF family extracellular repeat protein